MTILNILKNNSIKYPNKDCLVIDDLIFSYSEFYNEVIKTIIFFRKNNINKKNIVGIVEDNTLSHILSLFALSSIGAKTVPLNNHYSKNVILNIFKDLKIDILISNHTNAKFLKKKINFKKIISTTKSKKFLFFDDYKKIKFYKNKNKLTNNINDDYIILLTSGSTGNPKPIVFSQKNKIYRSRSMAKLYNISSSDRISITCLIDHSLGMRLLFLPILNCATCVVITKFTKDNYYECVKKNKITFSILVSSQINQIAADTHRFNNFYLKKGLVSSAGKLSNNLKKKIIKKKIKLYEMYGASEIGTVTSINLTKEKNKIHSVGKSYEKNIDIKILSKKNEFLSSNQKGEIICKTPALFTKYYKLANITKKSLFKGYFKTGDIGYLDKNKYLFFVGRKKYIIKRSGITIYPEDIENILLNTKNIDEVAVVGKKTPLNELVYLFVKKNKKINENLIKTICIKKMSIFQLPDKIILINNFKKTSIGKINKKSLLKLTN